MRHVIFIWAVVLCVLAGATAQSRVLSLEELSRAADVVVHGVVVSTTCQREADGRITTRVQLQPKEHWKGPTNNVPIVQAGGVLGDEAVLVAGQERYIAGEEIVAFLKINDRGEGVTFGMRQGKFNVWTSGTEILACNPFHGRRPTQPPKEAVGLTLDTLRSLVRGGLR